MLNSTMEGEYDTNLVMTNFKNLLLHISSFLSSRLQILTRLIFDVGVYYNVRAY